MGSCCMHNLWWQFYKRNWRTDLWHNYTCWTQRYWFYCELWLTAGEDDFFNIPGCHLADYILQFDRACFDASVFAAISVIWEPTRFIQWLNHCKNFFLTDGGTHTRHQSIYMPPDLEVCSQLKLTMLKWHCVGGSDARKPSPAEAEHQQPASSHQKLCQHGEV